MSFSSLLCALVPAHPSLWLVVVFCHRLLLSPSWLLQCIIVVVIFVILDTRLLLLLLQLSLMPVTSSTSHLSVFQLSSALTKGSNASPGQTQVAEEEDALPREKSEDKLGLISKKI